MSLSTASNLRRIFALRSRAGRFRGFGVQPRGGSGSIAWSSSTGRWTTCGLDPRYPSLTEKGGDVLIPRYPLPNSTLFHRFLTFRCRYSLQGDSTLDSFRHRPLATSPLANRDWWSRPSARWLTPTCASASALRYLGASSWGTSMPAQLGGGIWRPLCSMNASKPLLRRGDAKGADQQ